MKKWWLLAFIIASIVELSFILLDLPYRMISKPLLMVLLLGYYLQSDQSKNKVFIVALIFAWLGDVFLLSNGEINFMLGLGSFLFMQFCYIYVFYKQTAIFRKIDGLFLIGVLLYIFFFLKFLWPNLGEMKIPVIAYGLAFGTVMVTAFWRHKGFDGWKILLFGVVLFVISDSIIAINKFSMPIIKADFYIMFTYILGQFFIVEGYIRSKQAKI